jgi:hypothetical protein
MTRKPREFGALCERLSCPRDCPGPVGIDMKCSYKYPPLTPHVAFPRHYAENSSIFKFSMRSLPGPKSLYNQRQQACKFGWRIMIFNEECIREQHRYCPKIPGLGRFHRRSRSPAAILTLYAKKEEWPSLVQCRYNVRAEKYEPFSPKKRVCPRGLLVRDVLPKSCLAPNN